jgi:hypothetical protein
MAQGCTPPGEEFPSVVTISVVPRLVPGAMDADPLLCTAPASSGGLAILACQLLLRFTSVALTWSAGFGCQTLQAPSASAAATLWARRRA